MAEIFDIMTEPRGDVFKSLLSFCQKNFPTFSLVWRDQLDFQKSSLEFQKELLPYLIETKNTNEWPGTKLFGHKANLSRFHLNESSAHILMRADSLYSFRAPNLPEDLVIYNKDNSPWLVSISHEQDSYIENSGFSLSEIRKQVPGLSIHLHKDDGEE